MRTREAGEFLSGALAGAMTKAVLAPLETIRYFLINIILLYITTYFHSSRICLKWK